MILEDKDIKVLKIIRILKKMGKIYHNIKWIKLQLIMGFMEKEKLVKKRCKSDKNQKIKFKRKNKELLGKEYNKKGK